MSEGGCGLGHATIGHEHAIGVENPQEEHLVVHDKVAAVPVSDQEYHIENSSHTNLKACDADHLLKDTLCRAEAENMLGKEVRYVGEESPANKGEEFGCFHLTL